VNGIFRPHDYIRPVVSLMVVQIYVFQKVNSQGVVLGI